MRTRFIAGVLCALVAIGLVYWRWQSKAPDVQQTIAGAEQKAAVGAAAKSAPAGAVVTTAAKPAITTITLRKGIDADFPTRCAAMIDDQKIWGRPEKKVGWMVDDDLLHPCLPTGNYRLELEFTDADLPFNGGNRVNINRDVKTMRIKKEVRNPFRFTYKVHMVGQKDLDPYLLLDPELEVEPPPSLVPPPANPPPTPPSAPKPPPN